MYGGRGRGSGGGGYQRGGGFHRGGASQRGGGFHRGGFQRGGASQPVGGFQQHGGGSPPVGAFEQMHQQPDADGPDWMTPIPVTRASEFPYAKFVKDFKKSTKEDHYKCSYCGERARSAKDETARDHCICNKTHREKYAAEHNRGVSLYGGKSSSEATPPSLLQGGVPVDRGEIVIRIPAKTNPKRFDQLLKNNPKIELLCRDEETENAIVYAEVIIADNYRTKSGMRLDVETSPRPHFVDNEENRYPKYFTPRVPLTKGQKTEISLKPLNDWYKSTGVECFYLRIIVHRKIENWEDDPTAHFDLVYPLIVYVHEPRSSPLRSTLSGLGISGWITDGGFWAPCEKESIPIGVDQAIGITFQFRGDDKYRIESVENVDFMTYAHNMKTTAKEEQVFNDGSYSRSYRLQATAVNFDRANLLLVVKCVPREEWEQNRGEPFDFFMQIPLRQQAAISDQTWKRLKEVKPLADVCKQISNIPGLVPKLINRLVFRQKKKRDEPVSADSYNRAEETIAVVSVEEAGEALVDVAIIEEEGSEEEGTSDVAIVEEGSEEEEGTSDLAIAEGISEMVDPCDSDTSSPPPVLDESADETASGESDKKTIGGLVSSEAGQSTTNIGEAKCVADNVRAFKTPNDAYLAIIMLNIRDNNTRKMAMEILTGDFPQISNHVTNIGKILRTGYKPSASRHQIQEYLKISQQIAEVEEWIELAKKGGRVSLRLEEENQPKKGNNIVADRRQIRRFVIKKADLITAPRMFKGRKVLFSLREASVPDSPDSPTPPSSPSDMYEEIEIQYFEGQVERVCPFEGDITVLLETTNLPREAMVAAETNGTPIVARMDHVLYRKAYSHTMRAIGQMTSAHLSYILPPTPDAAAEIETIDSAKSDLREAIDTHLLSSRTRYNEEQRDCIGTTVASVGSNTCRVIQGPGGAGKTLVIAGTVETMIGGKFVPSPSIIDTIKTRVRHGSTSMDEPRRNVYRERSFYPNKECDDVFADYEFDDVEDDDDDIEDPSTPITPPPPSGSTPPTNAPTARPLGRVFVAAHSNLACDNIIAKLTSEGVDPKKIYQFIAFSRSDLKNEMLTYANVEWVDGQLRVVPASLDRLAAADVVVATIASSGWLYQNSNRIGTFSLLIVDESSQMTLAEFMVPLATVWKRRDDRFGLSVMLVGDLMQLPPVVEHADNYEQRGYHVDCESPMDLLSRGNQSDQSVVHDPFAEVLNRVFVGLLIKTYRGHELLFEFIAKYYYGGSKYFQCQTDASSINKYAELFRKLYYCPNGNEKQWNHGIRWFDTSGETDEDSQTKVGTSYKNLTEANIIVRWIRKLLAEGVKPEQIGVLTYYRAQEHLIKSLLRAPPLGARIARRITVGTTEKFQGSERPFMVLSTVRTGGKMWFMENVKRFVTSLTRAQYSMVIVGNSKALKHCRHWSRFIDYCEDNDLMQTENGKPCLKLDDEFEQSDSQLVQPSPMLLASTPIASPPIWTTLGRGAVRVERLRQWQQQQQAAAACGMTAATPTTSYVEPKPRGRGGRRLQCQQPTTPGGSREDE